MELGDISAYKIACEAANYIWDKVTNWDYLSKKTLGSQIIDSADSIGANIAEGYVNYLKN